MCGGGGAAPKLSNMRLILFFITETAFLFVFGPALALSKLVQVAYPWLIGGYLVHQGLLLQVDVF